MLANKLRIGLGLGEIHDLECLARREWTHLTFETVRSRNGVELSCNGLLISTADEVWSIYCRTVNPIVLDDHELFRLFIDRPKMRRPSLKEDETITLSPTGSAERLFDVGCKPQVYLVSMKEELLGPDPSSPLVEYTYPGGLLILGGKQRFLVHLDRLPGWIAITRDDRAIEASMEAAVLVEGPMGDRTNEQIGK